MKKKLQVEVNEYWSGHHIASDKLQLNEEDKLSIITYIVIQSGCGELYPLIKLLKKLIISNDYEESGALATFETAIKIIIGDYRK